VDTIEALRVKAMLGVMEDSFLYHYRRICRWYSQKFYTPLPVVEAMPETEVFLTFFETQFEDMSKSARRTAALEMTETKEESKARKAEEDSKSDEAFLERQAKKAKKEEKKLLAKLARDAAKAAKQIADMAGSEMAGPKKAKAPEPPEISMKFDHNGNLLDEESIPLPPPRKR
jgi:flagellar biosynthesis GTPase FlhF